MDLLGPGEQLLLGPQDFVDTISPGPSTVPTMEQMWKGLLKTTRTSVSEQFCPLHYLRLLPLESLVWKTSYLNLNWNAGAANSRFPIRKVHWEQRLCRIKFHLFKGPITIPFKSVVLMFNWTGRLYHKNRNIFKNISSYWKKKSAQVFLHFLCIRIHSLNF